MRKCPKCGAEFTDNDLRTMCSSCLVNLVQVDEPSPLDVMAIAGPISVGPSAPPSPVLATTIVMPEIEIRMPEIAIPSASVPLLPEVPQIRPPAPAEVPGPFPSPVTPQPEPDEPQPGIPMPQPAPVPVPAPQPGPAPMPQPQPVPQPAPMPLPPDPTQPSSQAPTIQFRRRLSPEEINSGNIQPVLFVIASCLCGLFTLIALFGTAAEDFSFLNLLLLGAFSTLTIFCIRQAIYRSTIGEVKVSPLRPPRLGASLPVEVVLHTLREIPVTDVELTITGIERLVSGNGRSETYRHTFYSHTVPLVQSGQWPAGQEVALTAQVPIPSNAMPTYNSQHGHIEWQLSLWVGIPGWYPDVRHRMPLTVPAVRGNTLPPITQRRYSLPNLGALNAAIALESLDIPDPRPVFPLGREMPLTLTMRPSVEASSQRVEVELVYEILGAGSNERYTVAKIPCFPSGWRAGEHQSFTGTLRIPKTAPVTFHGKHITIAWSLVVRYQIPRRQHQHQDAEILVVPAYEKE
ncbi:MAG: vacuolar protein sorting-associated family 26 protein [Armatimonadota bacterium]